MLGSNEVNLLRYFTQVIWPEMTDILNILIRCEFAYLAELNLASSAITKLYYAML